MRIQIYFSLMAMIPLLILGCASRTATQVTISNASPSKGGAQITKSVDSRTIESLKIEWEKEFVSATGGISPIKKYPDSLRNLELTRRAAILDAQRNLAEKIATIRITATSVMTDFIPTDVVRSEVQAKLDNVEIVSETFNTSSGRYEVIIRTPKLVALRILEEHLSGH